MTKQERVIFHVDVNSAYLSWEATDRLLNGEETDLRKIPSAVGGDEESRHGVVLARSVPSKKYGVKTGESLYMARKKCPDLKVVPARHEIYETYSKQFSDFLKNYSPIVEKISIDECFLDYTNMEMHFGPPLEAANKIREKIKSELGFTVNIGISTNKLLAKMAGEIKKPDLVHTLYPDEIQEKMWPLPVGELYMVGRVTGEKLNSKGIYRIGQLACTKKITIVDLLGKRGETIWDYANGIESSPVELEEQRAKGISNARTLKEDVKDIQTANKVILSLVENVAARLRSANAKAIVISVNLRTNEFVNYSRQVTLAQNTNSTTYIYETACQLFKEAWKGEPLRLIGVSANKLSYNDQAQLTLLDGEIEKKEQLDKIIDGIRNKYGESSLKRTSLLDNKKD